MLKRNNKSNIKKFTITFLTIYFITACSHINNVRQSNAILDQTWKKDIYNILYANINDIDHMQYWIRRDASYPGNSPNQLACVEVSEPKQDNKFYITNITNYTLTLIKSCKGEYWDYDNFLKYKKPPPFQGDEWEGIYQKPDDNSLFDKNNILLKFNDLFVINKYELTPNGVDTLIRVINELNKIRVSSLTIYGIADSSGDYKKNKALANKRAYSVRSFLIEEGIRDIPIAIRGSVENKLPTETERKTQRRFMIEVKLKNGQ